MSLRAFRVAEDGPAIPHGKRMKSFLNLLSNLFFPLRCPICDEPVKSNEGKACKACLPELRYVQEPTCLKCGQHLAYTRHEKQAEFCEGCQKRTHVYDRGIALLEYESISESIYRFKNSGRQEYADFFAEQIYAHMGAEIRSFNADCLIPVPLHKKRERRRGYNQAALLAQALSKHLNIPVDDKLVSRVKHTVPLKKLNLAERQINLKRAFKINRNDVELSTVIIIDDIYTTGSTMDEMAAELRRSGVKRVYFVTLAIGK